MASGRPMTSGMLLLFEPMVGAPQAIASSAGRPKPSCREGKTNRAAAPYSAIRASSLT
jgi:hypothetical protein